MIKKKEEELEYDFSALSSGAKHESFDSAEDEKKFQSWYRERAVRAGIDPDPDNPLHKYDYRAAYKAGAEPAISDEDGLYHWPSEYKDDDHPNRFVKGHDTKRESQGLDYDFGSLNADDKDGYDFNALRSSNDQMSPTEMLRQGGFLQPFNVEDKDPYELVDKFGFRPSTTSSKREDWTATKPLVSRGGKQLTPDNVLWSQATSDKINAAGGWVEDNFPDVSAAARLALRGANAFMGNMSSGNENFESVVAPKSKLEAGLAVPVEFGAMVKGLPGQAGKVAVNAATRASEEIAKKYGNKIVQTVLAPIEFSNATTSRAVWQMIKQSATEGGAMLGIGAIAPAVNRGEDAWNVAKEVAGSAAFGVALGPVTGVSSLLNSKTGRIVLTMGLMDMMKAKSGGKGWTTVDDAYNDIKNFSELDDTEKNELVAHGVGAAIDFWFGYKTPAIRRELVKARSPIVTELDPKEVDKVVETLIPEAHKQVHNDYFERANKYIEQFEPDTRPKSTEEIKVERQVVNKKTGKIQTKTKTKVVSTPVDKLKPQEETFQSDVERAEKSLYQPKLKDTIQETPVSRPEDRGPITLKSDAEKAAITEPLSKVSDESLKAADEKLARDADRASIAEDLRRVREERDTRARNKRSEKVNTELDRQQEMIEQEMEQRDWEELSQGQDVAAKTSEEVSAWRKKFVEDEALRRASRSEQLSALERQRLVNEIESRRAAEEASAETIEGYDRMQEPNQGIEPNRFSGMNKEQREERRIVLEYKLSDKTQSNENRRKALEELQKIDEFEESLRESPDYDSKNDINQGITPERAQQLTGKVEGVNHSDAKAVLEAAGKENQQQVLNGLKPAQQVEQATKDTLQTVNTVTKLAQKRKISFPEAQKDAIEALKTVAKMADADGKVSRAIIENVAREVGKGVEELFGKDLGPDGLTLSKIDELIKFHEGEMQKSPEVFEEGVKISKGSALDAITKDQRLHSAGMDGLLSALSRIKERDAIEGSPDEIARVNQLVERAAKKNALLRKVEAMDKGKKVDPLPVHEPGPDEVMASDGIYVKRNFLDIYERGLKEAEAEADAGGDTVQLNSMFGGITEDLWKGSDVGKKVEEIRANTSSTVSQTHKTIDAATNELASELNAMSPEAQRKSIDQMRKSMGLGPVAWKHTKDAFRMPFWTPETKSLNQALVKVDHRSSEVTAKAERALKFLQHQEVSPELAKAIFDSSITGERVGFDALSTADKETFNKINATMQMIRADFIRTMETAVDAKGKKLFSDKELKQFRSRTSNEYYFPLLRDDGNYVVYVNKGNKTLHAENFTSLKDADAAAKALIGKYEGGTIRMFDTRVSFGREFNMQTLMEMVHDLPHMELVLKKAGAKGEDVQQLVNILSGEYLKNWASGRLAKRENVAGYSMDVKKVLNTYVKSFPKSYHRRASAGIIAGEIAKMPQNMRAYGKALEDYVFGREKREGNVSYAIRNTLYMWNLGMKASFGMLNMTQRGTTTLWKALGDAGKDGLASFAKAQATEAKLVAEMIGANVEVGPAAWIKGDGVTSWDIVQKSKVLSPVERDVLMKLHDTGEIESLRNLEIIGKSKVMRTLGFIGSVSEKSNRIHSALTGIDIGVKKGLKGEELFDHTVNFMHSTQWQNRKANRPELGRGNIKSTLFVFKSYVMNDINFLSRAFPGNKKALAGAMATRLMLGGLGGVYGSDLLASVVDLVMEDVVGKKDWMGAKFEAKQLLASEFGQTAARSLMSGVPTLGDVEGSTVFGSSELFDIASVQFVNRVWKDFQAAKAGGDWSQFGKRNAPVALKHWLGWNTLNIFGKERFLEEDIRNLPAPLREKAQEIWDKLPKEMETTEKVLYALGFSTTTPKEFNDALYAISSTAANIRARKTELYRKIAKKLIRDGEANIEKEQKELSALGAHPRDAKFAVKEQMKYLRD